MAGTHLREALFGIGAAVLLLLFIGIHNAWDAVTYHVFEETENLAANYANDRESSSQISMVSVSTRDAVAGRKSLMNTKICVRNLQEIGVGHDAILNTGFLAGCD